MISIFQIIKIVAVVSICNQMPNISSFSLPNFSDFAGRAQRAYNVFIDEVPIASHVSEVTAIIRNSDSALSIATPRNLFIGGTFGVAFLGTIVYYNFDNLCHLRDLVLIGDTQIRGTNMIAHISQNLASTMTSSIISLDTNLNSRVLQDSVTNISAVVNSRLSDTGTLNASAHELRTNTADSGAGINFVNDNLHSCIEMSENLNADIGQASSFIRDILTNQAERRNFLIDGENHKTSSTDRFN